MKLNTLIKFARENFVGEVKGKLVDKYEVIKQLGKGGNAKVYEVKNKKTGEIRACKHLLNFKLKILNHSEEKLKS